MTGCFVCPIYDKRQDFEYGYEFVESAVNYGLAKDLYFIFSSQQQQDKFLSECEKRFHTQPNGLILEKDLTDCKNPVTIKKFYGLKMLADRYDYIAAVDCECIFIKSIPAGAMLDNVWQAGTFLAANRSVRGADVVLKCAIALNLQNNAKLISETGNFNYTWWFNDIPVYRTGDMEPFFEWLEKNDYLKAIYDNWDCFDYLVYGIWLILERNLKLKRFKVKDYVSIVEQLWRPEIPRKKAIEKTIGTHWTSRVKLEATDNPDIYMQFHRDRRHKHFRGGYIRRFLQPMLYRVQHPRNKIIS